jgi:hypothetical protein
MNKLFTIVKSGLGAGAQIAQSCHAVAAFAAHHPDPFGAWALPEQRNIVCLEAPELELLLARLEGAGHRCAAFRETDLGGELTAIACEEAGAKLLSSLPLAGRDPNRPTKRAPLGYVSLPVHEL